ncbi:MAG: FIST C-terminal domain-containing protein [Deltaproteobacteria bacterium]|nr:FIST C-terminal domain-containing protein [Deltaproteobacteria bacterium]
MTKTPASLLSVAASTAEDTDAAVGELVDGLDAPRASVVLAFASSYHDAPHLARRLAEEWPDALTLGCTTMGEVGPAGLTKGGVSIVALHPPCRASGVLLADLADFQFEEGRRIVGTLSNALGKDRSTLSPQEQVLVTLTDGLSGMEEILVASLGVYAPGIPLVGGSAGDDFRFQQTWAWCNGEARPGSGVVILLEPNVPFHAFHVHHYLPTETRVVVTDADPARRTIRELDGWPADRVMAQILSVSEEVFRSDPSGVAAERTVTLGFGVGDRFYLRSVMTLQGDELLMGGAVEEGAVLRVMQGGDLVERTAAGVQEALATLEGTPEGMLLFNCGGRMLEAESHGTVPELYRAMCPLPAAGFVTYGEQFGAMQVNHTLTGLVLAQPSGDAP